MSTIFSVIVVFYTYSIVLVICMPTSTSRTNVQCVDSKLNSDQCMKTFWSSHFDISSDIVSKSSSSSGVVCRLNETFSCIENYSGSDCVDNVRQSLLSNFIGAARNGQNRLCSNSDSLRKFIYHGKCLRDSVRSRLFNSRLDGLHGRLQKTLTYIRDDLFRNQRFPAICCSIQTYLSQFSRIVSDLCVDVTGPNTAEFFTTTLATMLEWITEINCPSLRKSCENLEDITILLDDKPSSTKSSTDDEESQDFFVFTLIDILAIHFHE